MRAKGFKMTVSIPEESSEVVRSTIKKEIKRLKTKKKAFREILAKYEKKLGLSSQEFIKKFKEEKMGDEQILFEWYADLETYQRITKKLELLEKVKFD